MDLLNYGFLIAQLNRLLDVKFTPDDPAYNSFLSLSIKSIIELFNKGDLVTQKYEIAKVAFLVNSLLEIEAKRPDILNKLKKKMKRAIQNHANYVGLRFEINQAYAFISKGIKIEYQDRPDFKVMASKNNNLFFECGSTHFFYEPKGDVLDKLDSVINEKSSKPYANPKTGLFIDVTNLVHMVVKNKVSGITDKIRERVKITANNYGTTLLTTYLVDNERDRYTCNYIRVDNPNIDLSLKEFLNEHYPYNAMLVNNYAIPNEG